MSGMETRFGHWIEHTVSLYKRHFAVLIPASLIGVVLSAGSFGILAGPMAAGMILIVLRLLDGRDPKPEATDIFRGFEFFVPTFLYVLAWGLLLLTLRLLLGHTLPGRFLAFALFLSAQVALCFGFFLVVDRRMDVQSAFLSSCRMVRPEFFPLLALVLMAGILAGAGVLACGIGIVATLPLGWILLAIAYRHISQNSAGSSIAMPPRPEPENG